MKRAAIITAIFAAALFMTGCDEHDHNSPAPPTNLLVLNGDGRADISWRYNRENDVAGYNVYFSFYYDGKYELIGSTSDNYFIDREARNGEKYYYAVTAYDYDGNESDLSKDEVYSAPRPEGFNVYLDNSMFYPNTSGYSFSSYAVVGYNQFPYVDFFFTVESDGRAFLDVYGDSDPNDGKDDGTYIKDMGLTNDIYDIMYAPETFPDDLYAEIFIGHTYVIWTWDNRFAKVRITDIQRGRLRFDWAYQTREGEPLLKRTGKERSGWDMEGKIKSLKARGIEIQK